jgi:hypothetical protein
VTIAAVRKQCCNLEILQRSRELHESLRFYLVDHSPANKRVVYGHVLRLHLELKPAGEISQHWPESLAFAVQETHAILAPALDDYVAILGPPRPPLRRAQGGLARPLLRRLHPRTRRRGARPQAPSHP